jgi:MFS family permease
MADRGSHSIRRWKAVWTYRMILSCLALVIALTVFLSAFILKFIHQGWIWVPVAMIISVIIAYLLLYKKISVSDVTSYIDRTFPLAEESASLLLKTEQELNYFERRQVEKINRQWISEIIIPPGIARRITWAVGALITSLVFAIAMYFVPIEKSMKGSALSNQKTAELKEKRIPGISGVSLTITPPSYTGRLTREQNFSI